MPSNKHPKKRSTKNSTRARMGRRYNPRGLGPGSPGQSVSLTTRYAVRLTHGSAKTTNSYVIHPSLSDFGSQLNGFPKYFQFYRINSMTVTVLNPCNVSSNNAANIYQLPYVVMAPVSNGDLPATLDMALAIKGAQHGILSHKYSVTLKPAVEVTTGRWTVSPLLNTKDGLTIDHHGISLWLERGGTGYTYDIIVEVQANFTFIGFDGADDETFEVTHEVVRPGSKPLGIATDRDHVQ